MIVGDQFVTAGPAARVGRCFPVWQVGLICRQSLRKAEKYLPICQESTTVLERTERVANEMQSMIGM